jgi:hypothetical protein
MRLPPKKRPGNPILASDWNTLIEALEARTPRTGSGMELVSSSGGFTYRVRNSAGSDERATCGNLRVFSKLPEGQTTPHLFVGVGQVGNVIISEDKDLGLIESNKGKLVLAKVTLNGTDGTYEAEIVSLADAPQSTDTVVHVLLGAVSDEGAVSQTACGPVSITVCRNWYAGEAPYFGMSVS